LSERKEDSMYRQTPAARRRGSSPFDPPWKGFLLGLPMGALVLIAYFGAPQPARGIRGSFGLLVGIFLAAEVLNLGVLAVTRRFARTGEQIRQRRGLALLSLGGITGIVIALLVVLAIG
jgi:hypothetical protein